MKILLDMVLNHTSDRHPWFLESKSSCSSPKRDWYVWKKGRGDQPPNNWQSMVHGSGWHYDDHTSSWYWASFLPFQPDLNWRNPEVSRYMTETLHFWLDKGADGFRLDIFDTILEDASFRDNPFAWNLIPKLSRGYGMFQKTVMNRHVPENIALAKKLRREVDSHDRQPHLLIGEVFGTMDILRQYCGETRPDGLNLVFMFQCLDAKVTASSYRSLIEHAETWFPPPFTPTWVFGNHDRRRSIEQCGNDRRKQKLRVMFQCTARGVPCLYYGDEIGMRQQDLPVRQSRDAVSRLLLEKYPSFLVSLIDRMMLGAVNRDNCRTPMLWDTSAGGGFSSSTAEFWLPPAREAGEISVEAQQEDPLSLLRFHQSILQLRKQTPSLHAGTLEFAETADPVLGFYRTLGQDRSLILLNFSRHTSDDLAEACPELLQGTLVCSTSGNSAHIGNAVRLAPWEGVVYKVPFK